MFSWSAVIDQSDLGSKSWKAGHYLQTIKQKHSLPAFRHHWPLSLYTTFFDLDLGWGSQKPQSKTRFLHFLAHFGNWSGLIWCGVEAAQADISALLLGDIYWIKEYDCCSDLETTMLACIQIFMNWSDSNFVWWSILLDSTFWYCSKWSWPWFKVTGVWESKTIFVQIISQFFQSVSTEIDVLLRLVGLMNHILSWLLVFFCGFFFFFFGTCLICIHRRELCLGDFNPKIIVNVGLHSNLFGSVSFNLCVTRNTVNQFDVPALTLNLLVSVVKVLSSKTHSCQDWICSENEKVRRKFLALDRGWKANSQFHQYLKKNTVSCAYLSSQTYTGCVVWCGVGH